MNENDKKIIYFILQVLPYCILSFGLLISILTLNIWYFVASIVIYVFVAIYMYFLIPEKNYLYSKYFKKIKNEFCLYNKNVIVKYNRFNFRITIQNLLNENQNFNADNYYQGINLFNIITKYFNANTTYNMLLQYFKNQGIMINENIKNVPAVDINNDNKNKIAKLPGINIAKAKQAIKYREENQGFKSKEEFYEALKLKQHYIEIIDKSIFVGKYDMLNEYQKEEIENPMQYGREVDF